MSIKDIKNFAENEFKKWMEEFGGKENVDYVWRCFIEKDSKFPEKGAFFGCIRPEEPATGKYYDFSCVVFPQENEGPWVIALGVGTLGFKNDYAIAVRPGTRRRFLKHTKKCNAEEVNYIKADISDLESTLVIPFIRKNARLNNFKNLEDTLKQYKQFLPVCIIIDDPYSENGKNKMKAFLAEYANLRNWNGNGIKDALKFLETDNKDSQNEKSVVRQLIEQRKYVILQGAPGTGKTRLAKEIAANESKNVFFTQFHAETTYADFVSGIMPVLKKQSVENEEKAINDIMYEEKAGVFVKAIKRAKALEEENSDEKVFLIIDEINRANLSNVLGEALYLFEYQGNDTVGTTDIKIKLASNLEISRLPKNLYVIGTMNTADRSLAVVDFALRRRFAWYTLRPHIIKVQDFCNNKFEEMERIFEKYATDEELALQPGQGYFIASGGDGGEEIKQRLRYELMPLIKEYLNEGLLNGAKDEFVSYFRNEIDEEMFL